MKSVDPNKHEVKFYIGATKEVTSNSRRIEEADSSVPFEEAASLLEPVRKGSVENNDSNYSPNSNELDDILFLIDDAGLNSFNDSDNKSNKDSNDEIEINSGDINLPADTQGTNNAASMPNELPLTYHQKLKVKQKELHELLGKSMVKEQNKLSIT